MPNDATTAPVDITDHTDPIVSRLLEALLRVDRVAARQLFSEQVAAVGALPVLEGPVAAALDRIGELWENGRLALSQVYMAGRICEQLSLSVLPDSNRERIHLPRFALAVFEDYHLLGKQLVHGVLRGSGFAVQDHGRIDLAQAVAVARSGSADVLMLSCLMLSSALRIEQLSATVARENLALKIVVGGAPFRFDHHLWLEVGAAAMGDRASQAPSLAFAVGGGTR